MAIARRALCRALVAVPLIVRPAPTPAAWFATSWEEPLVTEGERPWIPSIRSDANRAETHLAQLEAAGQKLQLMLRDWDELALDPSNGDLIRRQLGTVGITSPLCNIDRTLKLVRQDLGARSLLADEVAFVDASEELLSAIKQADFLAYSAIFGGSCCGGGRASEMPSANNPQKLALAPVEPGAAVGGGAAAGKAAVLRSETRDYLRRARIEVERATSAYSRLLAMVPAGGRLLTTTRVAASEAIVRTLTLGKAIDMIKTGCDPAFLAAVRESGGRFLYRGEDLPAPAALLSPPPDLLQIDAYGSKEAVSYFEKLESGLGAVKPANVARPSSGHIGVARAEAAAQWGATVSVWPIGQPIRYVWPKTRDDFFPASQAEGASALGGVEACNVDVGLTDALKLGREVLFATGSSNSFVAVSSSEDEQLRRQLFG